MQIVFMNIFGRGWPDYGLYDIVENKIDIYVGKKIYRQPFSWITY